MPIRRMSRRRRRSRGTLVCAGFAGGVTMGALAVGLVTVGYGSRMVASEVPEPAAAVLPADLGRLIDEYLERKGYVPEADLLLPELTEVPAPPEPAEPANVPLSQAVPVPLRSRAEQIEVADIPAQVDVAIGDAVPEVVGAIEETAPEAVDEVAAELIDAAEPPPVVLLGSPAEEGQEAEELMTAPQPVSVEPESVPVEEEPVTALVVSEPRHESRECAAADCGGAEDRPAEVWGEPSGEIAEPEALIESSAAEYEPAPMRVEPYAVAGVAGEY
ncbi:hypothetical protein [Saccharopolyspora sp. NPDC050642]|uniref:hypothetical protein n=1 Tax=Saccharopolyspora sp. NPDC050642 TaxID=3157099 RepID=UPI0033FC8246